MLDTIAFYQSHLKGNQMTILEKTLEHAGEARATVGVNGDDLQAGWYDSVAGTNGAGGLLSFPSTAAKGSSKWFASNNSGNYAITHTNASFGQSTAFLTPDPANAAGVHLVGAGAAPFINGNLVAAVGTGGLMADAGIPATAYQPLTVSVTLTAAQVIAAYATPEVLIPAVTGKVITVLAATVYTASTGETAFATGVAPIIQYGSTVHGAGTIAVGSGLVTGDITAAASQIRTLGAAGSTTYTGITDAPVTFSCTTAYTAGTGSTVTFTLVYMLTTAVI